MKTLILHVPEPTNEAAVMTALAVLVDQKLIELDNDLPLGWPGQPLSTAELHDQIKASLASPRMSAEEAKKWLGL
jgi:hypothetical protein